MTITNATTTTTPNKKPTAPTESSALIAARARKAKADATLTELLDKRSALESEANALEGKRADVANDEAAFKANSDERVRVAAALERLAFLIPGAEKEASEADAAVKRAMVAEADAAGEAVYQRLRSTAKAYLDAEQALTFAADALAAAHGPAIEHSGRVEALAAELGISFSSTVAPAEVLRDAPYGTGRHREKVRALAGAIAELRSNQETLFLTLMLRDLAQKCASSTSGPNREVL